MNQQILDNEALDKYKQTIINNGMTYQLVPPDMHRRNMDEKDIQAFKDHFLVILSGVDSSFPLHLWDRLLPQAEMTLNSLRKLKAAPKVSAWAYLFGPHDDKQIQFVRPNLFTNNDGSCPSTRDFRDI